MQIMEQYYISSQDGETKGPYSLDALEILCNQKKITGETLVCKEGADQWAPYSELLFSLASLQSQFRKTELPDSPMVIQDSESKTPEGISAVLKTIGSIALIGGIILFALSIKENEIISGSIFLASGILAAVSCFWMARVVELLSDIANKK
jgi:hypothetical protein